ncbi:MAG: hypothetical protein L0Z62_48175 [Gemmataceae bacterium]|nr:hypothetical protein [Gemmataceae bacterium]
MRRSLLGLLLVGLFVVPPLGGPEVTAQPPAGGPTNGTDALPEGALLRLGTTRLRHADQVLAVAFSPDSKLVASGCKDGSIALWDAATGAPRGRLLGHNSNVCALAFTPEGKSLVSRGTTRGAGLIAVWDLASAKMVRQFSGPIPDSGSLALSRDGRLLAADGVGSAIQLWELPTGKEVGRLTLPKAAGLVSFALSADGKLLAASHGKGMVLFDVATRKSLREWGRRDEPVPGFGFPLALALSADGRTLAGGAPRTRTNGPCTCGTRVRGGNSRNFSSRASRSAPRGYSTPSASRRTASCSRSAPSWVPFSCGTWPPGKCGRPWPDIRARWWRWRSRPMAGGW